MSWQLPERTGKNQNCLTEQKPKALLFNPTCSVCVWFGNCDSQVDYEICNAEGIVKAESWWIQSE
jgi:hypothetical protein